MGALELTRERDKYRVAVLVYHLARCAFVLCYRSRPCLMRRKWSARIVALALFNAKALAIATFQVVHCFIPSLSLRPKYSTFARDSDPES